jgi:hypothetical protein
MKIQIHNLNIKKFLEKIKKKWTFQRKKNLQQEH